MDIVRIAEMQQEIAADLVAHAPEGWERVVERVTSLAGAAAFDIQALRGGVWERFSAGPAAMRLQDLQDVMYDPAKGAWFSATCTVEPSGAYHFTFNYDQYVRYTQDRHALEESWVKELRRHPRPWALIPDWHPVRKRFTEQEWAADLASNDIPNPDLTRPSRLREKAMLNGRSAR